MLEPARLHVQSSFVLTYDNQSREKEGAGVLEVDLRHGLGTFSRPPKECGAHCCAAGHTDRLPSDEFHGVRCNLSVCDYPVQMFVYGAGLLLIPS